METSREREGEATYAFVDALEEIEVLEATVCAMAGLHLYGPNSAAGESWQAKCSQGATQQYAEPRAAR